VQNKGSCNGHALALPTGKLVRIPETVFWLQANVMQGPGDCRIHVRQPLYNQGFAQGVIYRLARMK